MIRLATRKSALALAQTHEVKRLIEGLGHAVQLLELVTIGDQIQNKSLADIGGKGLFIKRLEEALLAHEAEIAVHSLKDVPPVLDPEFCIAAVLPRISPHDVLVSHQYGFLKDLPPGAKIGTSSVRRSAALLHHRPDIVMVPMRGNVDTRLKKLAAGECDALILAEAGLSRLHLESSITERLSIDFCTPSVGQGIIALECLNNREDLKALLNHLNHPSTFACMTAERAMNQHLGASCTSPVGSYAYIDNEVLNLKGTIWSLDGRHKADTLQMGHPHDAIAIGQRAACDLLANTCFDTM